MVVVSAAIIVLSKVETRQEVSLWNSRRVRSTSARLFMRSTEEIDRVESHTPESTI